MSGTHRVIKIGLFVLFLLVGNRVWCCEALSKTELESIFCQIKGQAPLLKSMSIQDFRNNPEQTQRLLLSRPAKKLGIALPKISSLKSSPKAKSSSQSNHVDTKAKAKAVAASQDPVVSDKNLNGMENCALSDMSIVCGERLFHRVFNRANRYLDEHALGKENQLSDAQFIEAKAQSESQYLRKFYQEYLMKMLSIGLSEHTLSYTKFVNLFQLSSQEGVDFAKRMSKMFEYLKTDKSNMQVKVDNGSAPEDIEQCFRLGSSLIVCDNVQANWIYQFGG